MSGKFVISLDFELRWGAVEKYKLPELHQYFIDTREKAIPQLLELFDKFHINATWATVGFLFADNKEQLSKYLPLLKPSYKKNDLNYYKNIEEIGLNEKLDPYHFAFSLIKLIQAYKGQEIGSHTFAHYYCNEDGQTLEQFNDDLQAMENIARDTIGIPIKSLVFPRNQYNVNYLEAAFKRGIRVVRSNPQNWFFRYKLGKVSDLFRKIDKLIPISNSYIDEKKLIIRNGVVELPSSNFLTIYSPKIALFNKIQLWRIKVEMTKAAKKGMVYHLWWHPHNFGQYTNKNIDQLREILEHYNKLNDKYGFTSVSMGSFTN